MAGLKRRKPATTRGLFSITISLALTTIAVSAANNDPSDTMRNIPKSILRQRRAQVTVTAFPQNIERGVGSTTAPEDEDETATVIESKNDRRGWPTPAPVASPTPAPVTRSTPAPVPRPTPAPVPRPTPSPVSTVNAIQQSATVPPKNPPPTPNPLTPWLDELDPDFEIEITPVDNNNNNNNNNSNTMARKRRRTYRIAMVCDFFYPRMGGVEMHIWSLSQHLIRLGHKVIVVTHSYANRKGVRYMEDNLKVYYCPFIPMTDQDILPTLTATFPLWRSIMIREGIEIVHTHQATSVMSNESVVYASALGLPSVFTDHSLFQFDDVAGVVLNRVLEVTLGATLNAAICVSHACRDNLILRAKLDPNRIDVIPNAVDPSKFTPVPEADRQPLTETNRIKVVVVSRLVYRKGVDLLVGIIPQICDLLPQVDFIVGGDGNKLLSLQEMVEREHLQDRVTFLGAVPHKDVASVLRQGHVFLNCSLTESFCIAILEAASCGLLVVSTNVGGVPEVLEPDMIVLCDPNVEALVQGVQQAIKRQEGDGALDPWDAHRRIERMYSWHRVAVQTVRVYDRIIQDKPMTFLERLRRHQRLGGLSGIIVCALALYIELWIRFVEWMHPAEAIDVVPSLVPPPS